MDNTSAVPAVSAVSASAGSSFQTIVVLVLFVAVIAALPWLLRRWQQRQLQARGEQGLQTQVLSTVALGPGQRIVVVEVGQGAQRSRLVLGVTAQQIQCLHVLGEHSTVEASAATSFSGAMERLQQGAVATGAPGGNITP